MIPATPTPQPPSPGKSLSIRQIAAIIAMVLVITGLVGTLALVHGKTQSSIAATRAETPTTLGALTPTRSTTPSIDSTATATQQNTPVPGQHTPTATSAASPTARTPAADVQITQNQNEVASCMDVINPPPYTMTLYDAGTDTANWQVDFPLNSSFALNDPISGQRPLRPHSGAFYWGQANPASGSIAPGQSASIVVTLLQIMPCGGSAGYQASIQLSFPSGATESNLSFTYVGTGPEPDSNVVLTSGSLNITEACPTGGSTPMPFTFAIKNIGNGTAYPYLVFTTDSGQYNWATVQSTTYDPPNPAVTTWLYAGETWTVTIAPSNQVQCGVNYHVDVDINNTTSAPTTIVINDIFQ